MTDAVRTRALLAAVERELPPLAPLVGALTPRSALEQQHTERLWRAWRELEGGLGLEAASALRACPHCGRDGMHDATRCGHCWRPLARHA